ncbi:MAG: medium chain dehydrogenase/reductase family protein [candidate division KSB1 bacterium]|nr:medium chain dehydrogenase/reductase family protein [candidate division KSB1 bacterium]MDZ7273961.1 medium chain dehydrogenase/reductase family protein [candidate division KSB1 bacterium]MDZ7286334.1 medium chain dehydrogenase/reductase family protein [candidate division KSB1 bacterium]MDZ7296562.1 medium chain dehydrogenase/reductase family protein [candidate division KSB1 bacterium]MDZ7306095.1 medium chain dehydrogenase/reductase family protein [candidate division KSB1 bacterium]
MKQVFITKPGGVEVLQVRESSDPKPKSGEVVIRVKAAGINFADLMARKGIYPDAPKPPCVVGYEVCGTIAAVGEGVAASEVGREVIALTRFGGYAEKVSVPHRQTFAKPGRLSSVEAAALPVAYLTAYQAVVVMGALQPGEAILIHNAGGGVGLAALDFAKKIGATVYGTAGAAKHEFLKQRGCDHPIDYHTQDWQKELQRLTGGRGVELILDPLGGKNWKKSYKALRATGRLGMCGISTAAEARVGVLGLLRLITQMPWFNPVALMNSNKAVFGINLGHMWHEVGKVTGWMQKILAGVEEGWIRPFVGKTFPLEQAAQAHRYIEERRNIGKVVLVM